MVMTALPKTRFAKSGDVHVAYQVLGDGPVDLVFVPLLASRLAVGDRQKLLESDQSRVRSLSPAPILETQKWRTRNSVAGSPDGRPRGLLFQISQSRHRGHASSDVCRILASSRRRS